MTDDGEMLVAWHFPPRHGHPLILYFHGNGGALVDRVSRFRMFAAGGHGLLAVSYRGYGGSTGSPTQTGLMRDGEAAYREARVRGYESNHIVLMGESLGTRDRTGCHSRSNRSRARLALLVGSRCRRRAL